eukprot:gene9701-1906_t
MNTSFLALLFVFASIYICYANVPSASCATVEVFDLLEPTSENSNFEQFDILSETKDCRDKTVCRIFCPRLNATFQNSTYTELLDLTGIYNQTNVTEKSYVFSCLSRYWDNGVDDWTDPNSKLFRDYVYNISKSSFQEYFATHPPCSKFVNVPNITEKNPDSLLQLGYKWEDILLCFENIDSNYLTHVGVNVTLDTYNVLFSVLLYKDTFKGFQKFCLDKIYHLGLTGEALKNRTRQALFDYENFQRVSYNTTPWKGDEFKNPYYNMYFFDEIYKKLENNGSLHLIKPIYDQFVELFSSTVLDNTNRRYCRCESMQEFVNREVVNDRELPVELRVLGDVSSDSNFNKMNQFVGGLYSICNAHMAQKSPVASPMSSPKVSSGMTPQTSSGMMPQDSFGTPPPPQDSITPPPQTSSGNSPQTSSAPPQPSPQTSSGMTPQVSSGNSPNASPKASSGNSPKSSATTSPSPVVSRSTRIYSSFSTTSSGITPQDSNSLPHTSPNLSPYASPSNSPQESIAPQQSKFPQSSSAPQESLTPQTSPKNSPHRSTPQVSPKTSEKPHNSESPIFSPNPGMSTRTSASATNSPKITVKPGSPIVSISTKNDPTLIIIVIMIIFQLLIQ